MDNTHIRLVVNQEHTKISKILGKKALSYLFDKFCNIFTIVLQKYFKVISVHHRHEIKQGQYVFICTVLSNQNNSKGRHKIYKTMYSDKYVITKGELQNEFDKQFDDNIIYNKMHFTTVYIQLDFKNIPYDMIRNKLCDAIDSYYNISLRNKVFKNKAILQSEKIAVVIKNVELDCLVIPNKTFKLITYVCGDYVWQKSIWNHNIIDIQYIEYICDNEQETINPNEIMLYCKFYLQYFAKSKMILLPEYFKIYNSVTSEVKYINLEDFPNYKIQPNELINFLYPDTHIINGYPKKKHILFYDFFNTHIIKECKVCMEYFYREWQYNKHILRNVNACHTKLCPSCFNGYVNSEIDTYLTNKSIKFICKCPVQNCNSKIFQIEDNIIFIINKFYKYLAKSTISRLKLIQSNILINENIPKIIRTREEAEKDLKELIEADTSENPTLSQNINICPNIQCNTIIIRSSGCNAIVCSKCSTKLCIICGVFNIEKNKCNCMQSINIHYFENRQFLDLNNYGGLLNMEPILI